MKQYPFETRITHRNVRNSRIRIEPDCTVHVTLPHGADPSEIIDSKMGWILKKIGELNSLASIYQNSDGSFLFDGRMWHLVYLESSDVEFRWPDICYPSVVQLKRSLVDLLRTDITARLEDYSAVMGVDYGRVSLRKQKTRWASCSGKGNLNFNLRAMAVSGEIRDYLVVHELSHRLEMNHSKAFWRTVGEHYPDYRAAEKDLKACWVAIGRNRIWNAILE